MDTWNSRLHVVLNFFPDNVSQGNSTEDPDDEDVEEDDDDEYDDVEEILLEKRVTFYMIENNQWKVSYWIHITSLVNRNT